MTPPIHALPHWVADSTGYGGYSCGDRLAQAFAFHCFFDHQFSIPEYDTWLSLLDPSGAKDELIGRRSAAIDAMNAQNHDLLVRHLEWMLLRQRAIQRERFLRPLAHREAVAQAGRQKGSDKGGKVKAAAAQDWQLPMIEAAKKLDADGRPRREWAAILARRFNKSATTIRVVLRKANAG